MAWEEVPDARWRALLKVFRTSSAPVQAAVRWAETQGYGGALGSASTQRNTGGLLQSVSRFVPELLAKPVVVIEQEEQGDKPVSIYNHLWIQALPSTMQTDIVTFLSATRRHFLFKNGALDQNLAVVEEYNSLPSWLEEYKGSESVLFFGLSPRVGEPQVPAEVANNNRVENVVHIGGGDQEELSTSQTNSQSKRKHGEAELEGISSEVREDQAPEDTGTKNLQVDADENSARVILGDVVFARAKSLSCWLTFRDRHAIQRFEFVCCSQCRQTMASFYSSSPAEANHHAGASVEDAGRGCA